MKLILKEISSSRKEIRITLNSIKINNVFILNKTNIKLLTNYFDA